MPAIRMWLTVWLVIAGLAAMSAAAYGAGSEEVQDNIASIKQKIEQLKKQDESTQQKKRLSTYKKALAAYQSAADYYNKIAQLEAKVENAQSQIAQYQAKRKKVANKDPEQVEAGSVSELTDKAAALERKLKSYNAQLSAVRDRLAKLASLPDRAHSTLRDLRAKRRKQKQALSTSGPPAITEQQSRAKAVLAEARRTETAAHITWLEKSLSSLDVRKRLANAKRALIEARITYVNQRLAAVNQTLIAKRQQSARELADKAASRLSAFRTGEGIVQKVAHENVELAQKLVDRVGKTDDLGQARAMARDRLETLQRRLNLIHQQLKIGAGSVALGDLLRRQLRRLPNPAAFGLPGEGFKQVDNLASVQLRNFQLSQQIHDLRDLEKRAHALARKAGVTLDKSELQSLVDQLKLRRRILERLQSATGRYIDIGRTLSQLAHQFDETLTNFRQLLKERLFWLPSSGSIDVAWLGRFATTIPAFFSPSRWAAVVQAFWRGLGTHPVATAFGVIFLAALFFVCRLLPLRLGRLAKPVGRVSDDTIWLTLRAGLMTLIMTAPVPLTLIGVASLIFEGSKPDAFAAAVGSGIFQLALLVFYLNVFIQITRDDGLADAHFKWPQGARRTLLRSLIWLLGLLLVPSFFVGIVMQTHSEALRETIGLASLMVSSMVLAGFAFRFFLPARGVLSQVFAQEGHNWRPGYLWLPVGVVIPLALAVIAATGYFYTALQLQSRFFYSIALLGGATVIYGIVVRWLTVVVRRLALQKARRRREEARQARAARDQGSEASPENLDEPEIGLPQIGEQTRGLIKFVVTLLIGFGLWSIWSNTLPALGVLNEITLWSNTSTVNGHLQSVNITLGALLLSLVVGVGTVIAGRNLPGFLEITVLQRFSMTSGSRYAVATLFKYAIVVIGILVAVTLIGFHWSSIQWLVAAVGVGLGFGLQAIFANFVSGLIILFERPVRVGDITTVGTLTGVISRVRIRATTITDWDNKEVIIPNQTFITETVVNWTLTDDVARLVIQVRVAYESDTEKVQQLIHDAINAQPQVLETPPATVYLVGFDDSGLRFDGRVYYRDPYNNWMPLQHELYKAVQGALADQDVRITFEQRDLHLRSVDNSLAGLFGWGRRDESRAERQVESSSGDEAGSSTDKKRTRSTPSGGDGGGGDGGG